MIVVNDRSDTGDFWYGRPISEGTWPAIVLDAAEQISQAGNPMVVLVLGIEGDGDEGGVKIDKYVPCHVPYRVGQVVSCFFRDQQKAWDAGDEINLDPTEILGMKCKAEVKFETYNDQEQAKIDNLFPVDDYKSDVPF